MIEWRVVWKSKHVAAVLLIVIEMHAVVVERILHVVLETLLLKWHPVIMKIIGLLTQAITLFLEIISLLREFILVVLVVGRLFGV